MTAGALHAASAVAAAARARAAMGFDGPGGGVGGMGGGVGDRQAQLLARAKLVLARLPMCVPFDHRVAIFQEVLAAERALHRDEEFAWGGAGGSMNVEVRRQYLFEDAFQKLAHVPEQRLKNRLQIAFKGEAGIDGGGLLKEFLDELAKRMFDPMLGLFRATDPGFS